MRSEIDAPTFPAGQFQQREMSDLYGFDGSVWRRVLVDITGRLVVVGGGGGGGVGITDTDDNSIVPGQTTLLAIDENYVFDGTNWIRWQGGTDATAAPATPQGGFTAGKVITTFPVFVAGNVAVDRFTVDGAKLEIPRTQEPFELTLSQAAIAASATFTSAVVQQNSLFAGSLGRTLLHGLVNYAGTASSLTVNVDISLDAGATFVTTDTVTVLSGMPTVIRNLSVALGNRVRIRVVNNDGANGSGTTNIAFYLTHAN
jgi:hypothetical protein